MEPNLNESFRSLFYYFPATQSLIPHPCRLRFSLPLVRPICLDESARQSENPLQAEWVFLTKTIEFSVRLVEKIRQSLVSRAVYENCVDDNADQPIQCVGPSLFIFSNRPSEQSHDENDKATAISERISGYCTYDSSCATMNKDPYLIRLGNRLTSGLSKIESAGPRRRGCSG